MHDTHNILTLAKENSTSIVVEGFFPQAEIEIYRFKEYEAVTDAFAEASLQLSEWVNAIKEPETYRTVELYINPSLGYLERNKTSETNEYVHVMLSNLHKTLSSLPSWNTPFCVSQEPLYDALKALQGAMKEARKEEFILPSDMALRNAKSLLTKMYNISPRYFEVYPTEDGDISIDVPGGYNCSFVALCYNDGRVLCLVNIKGDRDMNLYENAELLPNLFVINALERLHQVSDEEWLVQN